MAAIIAGPVAAAGIAPTFWALPTAMLTGSAAAGGIALINAVGNLGGFLGPYLMGLSGRNRQLPAGSADDRHGVDRCGCGRAGARP